MKNFALTIILFLIGTVAYAQADTVYVWNKWCARKDTLLLFSAANNVIQIHCRGLKGDEIKVKSLDANALRIGNPEVKGDTLSVMAMPYPSKCKNKNMRLSIMHKKTGKLIKNINFSCDSVPPLEARFGKLQGNELQRKDMLTQTAVFCVFPNSLYSYPYRIKQYVFKIVTPNGAATIPVNGIFLNRDIFQQIKDAPAGTVAEITGIKATCPECTPRTLNDLKIKIKG